MIPRSTVNATKNRILHSLPIAVRWWYFRQRGFEQCVKVEALQGVEFEIGYYESALWANRLNRLGGHEPRICRWIANNIGWAEHFVDVGSHFGFFPALVSTVSPSTQVHAIQPEAYALHFLYFNSLRYHTANWKIVPKFAGALANAQTVTLDEYASTLSEGGSMIIKVDVDGPEFDVVFGARNLISQQRAVCLIELHPEIMLARYQRSVSEVLDVFRSTCDIFYLSDVRSEGCWSNNPDSIADDPNPYVACVPKGCENVDFS